MTIATLPNTFDQQKLKRLNKQAQKLAVIQAQPEEIWVDLLLEYWPQALPEYVLCRLLEQGYAHYAQEHIDVVGSRQHFKNLDATLDAMEHAFTDDAVVDMYQNLGKNNPEILSHAQDMLAFIAALPKPTQIVVVGSDILLLAAMKSTGVVNHPEEERMICETRSRPSRFLMDNNWDQDQRSYLEGAVVAGLAHKGGVQIRHPLPLRVQRPNQHGVMEWVAQEKIYGFALIQGEITPLSIQQLTNAHFTGPNGEHLPLEIGTHMGNTVKEFAAFKKRRS